MSACTIEVSLSPESSQFWDEQRPLCDSIGIVSFLGAETVNGKIRVIRSENGNGDGYVIEYDSPEVDCSMWTQCNTALWSMMVNAILFIILSIFLFMEVSRYNEYRKQLQFKQVSFAGLSAKVM